MPILVLPKGYDDGEVLFNSHLTDMWTAVESLVNDTGLDEDNFQVGAIPLSSLSFPDETQLLIGTTSSAYLELDGATNSLFIGNTYSGANIDFYINTTVVGRLDSSKNISVPQNLFMAERNVDYSVARLIGTYRKPVLVWQSTTSLSVENNTEVTNETLIVLPSGPIAVTEDISAAHKYRKLVMTDTANGYDAADVGNADSGKRDGLVISDNRWYFIYAARVRYGADAGNRFILVLDDTSPLQANESTLNTRYGTNEWVYLGCVRYGYGSSSTTANALVKFQMSKDGWSFVYANDTNDAAGIEVDKSNTSGTHTLYTISVADTGDAIPAVCDSVQMQVSIDDYNDSTFSSATFWYDASSHLMARFPTQYLDVSSKAGAQWKMPVYSGQYIEGEVIHAGDTDLATYITGWCDFYV